MGRSLCFHRAHAQTGTDQAARARVDRPASGRRGHPFRAPAERRARNLAADRARGSGRPRPRRLSRAAPGLGHVRQRAEDRPAVDAHLVQRGHAPTRHGRRKPHDRAARDPRGRCSRARAERLSGRSRHADPPSATRRRRADGPRDAARSRIPRPRPRTRPARELVVLRPARARLRRRDLARHAVDRADGDERGGVRTARRAAALAGIPVRAHQPHGRRRDGRVRALALPRRPLPPRGGAVAAPRPPRSRATCARRRGMTRAGVSYFGVRILRHVRRDLADIAARGYTSVLHTFSENDLAYYRGTMANIVAASHDVGLEVQMCPWGLGRTFGGEAESRWVTMHPEACQVLDDGRRVATGCLNQPAYRSFCKEWADAALECGTDYVFWDEPHWTVPDHVGIADPDRWACCCDVCRELAGGLPTQEFREASLVEFLREMTARVAARGGKNTICLLPLTEGSHGIKDWDAVAALPGLDVFATDPYWKNFDEEPGAFVGRFAKLLAETAARHGVRPQLWVPSFGLTRENIPDLEAAIESTRAAGIDDVWTWGYEACGHMTRLATPAAPLVWEAVTHALTEQPPLELRPTHDLVRSINVGDATVSDAVARANDEVAAAIDAIVERLERGGRLVYVGAGTSGRIAASDAAECGPTFSTDLISAVHTEVEAEEDDADLACVDVGQRDVVLGVSASGRTPYTLGALSQARSAGALTIGLACVPDSELARAADLAVEVDVGPEFISGSTRMKAGTAQKLVLNTISTVTMVKLGKTFGDLMVDVQAANEKLRARARTAVALATAASDEKVTAAMAAAGGDAKVAIVSLLAGVDAETARSRLSATHGVIREAVADVVG